MGLLARGALLLCPFQPVGIGGNNSLCDLVLQESGRGSNALVYAWFAQYLAARGYVVAAIDHYRANSYDSTIAYLANKLWQRPRDISLAITFLLSRPDFGPAIDRDRIGAAGHSQGGFTALWLGGAEVNPDKYLQRGCRPISGGNCRSIRNPLFTFATAASRRPSPWPPASSRPSAWTRPASAA